MIIATKYFFFLVIVIKFKIIRSLKYITMYKNLAKKKKSEVYNAAF